MILKSQLLRFLSRIPSARTSRERQALLDITGFDRLSIHIAFEGNNVVFFSDLLNHLISEGQIEICQFLRSLSNSGLLGLEDNHTLVNFVHQIETLSILDWQQEFLGNFRQATTARNSSIEPQLLIRSQIQYLTEQQGISAAISYTVATPILDVPPLDENSSARQTTVRSIVDLFENHSWIAIYGSVGSGKTQLAILIAQALNSCRAWIRFRDMTVEQACVRLDIACGELTGIPPQSNRHEWYSQLCERLGSGTMIILDDLPRFLGGNDLSERLAQLVRACSANQIKLLSTSAYSLPNSLVSSISSTFFQLNSPPFSEFEASEVLQAYGASSSFAPRIAKFVNTLAHHNPLLINAIAKYLSEQNWQFTEEALEGLFKSEYVGELNSEIINKILSTVEDVATRELFYRLTLIDNDFSLKDVQGLAVVEPVIQHPNDKLTSLIGLWIQRDANQRLLTSPLVKRLGSINLLPATKRDCHLWLGDRIVRKHQLTRLDILQAFNHFCSAEEFNRAGTILILALGEMSRAEVQADDFLSAIWTHIPLPNEMDLSIRIILRGLQVILNYKNNKDVSYISQDLDVLIQQASQREAFAVVGAAMYMGMTFAQSNPVLANQYLLTSLQSLPQARLPDGSELALPEETQPEQLIWMTSIGISTIEHLHNWIETVKQLTVNQRNRVFTSEIAEEGCLLLLDNLYRLEKSKPDEEQQWQVVVRAVAELANQARELGLDLLFGCAVRVQITIIVKHCSNIEAAIAVAEVATSYGISDDRALLLIQECIGRYCLDAQRNYQALSWLNQAMEQDTNAYPSIRLDVLLNISFAIGKTEPQTAIHYLQQAINLARSSEKILEENLARALGELTIAYWLVDDLEVAFDVWEQACERLLAIKIDTDDWKELLVRFGHLSGYLTALVSNGVLPDLEGQQYPPPHRAFFFQYNSALVNRYRTVLDSFLASQLARYAEAVGKDKQAAAWALRGIDIARETNQLFALPVLSENAVPQLLLDNRYAEVFELALEAGTILVSINRHRQDGGDSLDFNFNPAAFLGENPIQLQQQAEHYSARLALLPIAFRLGMLAVVQPDVAHEHCITVATLCCQISEKAIEQSWLVAADLFEKTYSAKASFKELINLGNTFVSQEENVFLEVLWSASYLGASLQSDVKLEDALITHLYVVRRMYLSLKPPSQIYRRIILPFVETYWRVKFEKMRFRFRSPLMIEGELAKALTLPADKQAQAIFNALSFGLGVPIPPELLSWL